MGHTSAREEGLSIFDECVYLKIWEIFAKLGVKLCLASPTPHLRRYSKGNLGSCIKPEGLTAAPRSR